MFLFPSYSFTFQNHHPWCFFGETLEKIVRLISNLGVGNFWPLSVSRASASRRPSNCFWPSALTTWSWHVEVKSWECRQPKNWDVAAWSWGFWGVKLPNFRSHQGFDAFFFRQDGFCWHENRFRDTHKSELANGNPKVTYLPLPLPSQISFTFCVSIYSIHRSTLLLVVSLATYNPPLNKNDICRMYADYENNTINPIEHPKTRNCLSTYHEDLKQAGQ